MKKGIQIKEDIYWVGVRDFNNRHFHGSLYPIQEGATYNAYLVVDDEVTLFDTVEEEFAEEMLERIRSVIGDRPVDNIIVQHAEPDHSGGFLHVMRAYPQAKVYASNAGANNMMKQYFKEVEYNRVKTKDTLSTGKHQFTFVEMPLIHWPDNMLTYDAEAKIVFSNDAFGQHIVSFKLFDEAHDLSFCLDKAKEYYANIVMPYGAQVSAKLRQIQEMNLEIEMIAPAHGIIWKSYIPQLLEAYEGFASFRSTDKAVIVYESVWSHTRQMAEEVARGLSEAGIRKIVVHDAARTPLSFILSDQGKESAGLRRLRMVRQHRKDHQRTAAGCRIRPGQRRRALPVLHAERRRPGSIYRDRPCHRSGGHAIRQAAIVLQRPPK